MQPKSQDLPVDDRLAAKLPGPLALCNRQSVLVIVLFAGGAATLACILRRRITRHAGRQLQQLARPVDVGGAAGSLRLIRIPCARIAPGGQPDAFVRTWARNVATPRLTCDMLQANLCSLNQLRALAGLLTHIG